MKVLIYYDGGLGPEVHARLDQARSLRFQPGEVRKVTADQGRDLAQFAGFLPAYNRAQVAARYGLKVPDLAPLTLRTAHYHGGEVIVLDDATAATLRATAAAEVEQ